MTMWPRRLVLARARLPNPALWTASFPFDQLGWYEQATLASRSNLLSISNPLSAGKYVADSPPQLAGAACNEPLCATNQQIQGHQLSRSSLLLCLHGRFPAQASNTASQGCVMFAEDSRSSTRKIDVRQMHTFARAAILP